MPQVPTPKVLLRRQRWTLLFVVSLGLVLIALDNSILYTALPTLREQLRASNSEGLWIINAYPLVMAGLLLGSGTLGDRIGHARMFIAGLIIFGLASIVAAFAPVAWVLIAARAVLAVGAAAMMPATLAIIRTNFHDERERNLAIAIWGSVAVVGAAIGPLVGGVLLEFFWWGSVFLVNVPVVLIALVAFLAMRVPNATDSSKRWDYISSLLAMVGLVGLVLAIKEIGNNPPSALVIVGSLLIAVVGLGLFARRQVRMADPLIDFAIFRNPAFSAGVIAAAISMFALSGVELSTSQRFQLVAGFSPLETGYVIVAVALATLPTSILGGAVLHIVGLRVIIAGGFALGAVGTTISVIGFSTSFVTFLIGLILLGAGLGAVFAVASTAILGNAPIRRAGMASSIEEVSYEFGSLTAVAILGSLLSFLYTRFVSLPAGTPAIAGESMMDAIHAAAGDQAILEAAGRAYDDSYVVVLIVVAALLAVGSAVTAILLRRYGPGTKSQSFTEYDEPAPVG